jgi:transposase-like protein
MPDDTDTDDTERCGHPTADGSPCQHPATDGDSCWLAEHGGDAAPSGRDREPPSKQTQELIANVIEQGASIAEACRRAGVHRETFYRWMQFGEEEEAGPFQEFRDRLVRARGEGEAQYRKTLLELAEASEDTATLMAMLKQRYPESWGDVDRGEQSGGVTVNVGSPEDHEIDPDTLETIDE